MDEEHKLMMMIVDDEHYVDVLYFHNIDVLRCSYLEGGKITTEENNMWFKRLVLVVFGSWDEILQIVFILFRYT